MLILSEMMTYKTLYEQALDEIKGYKHQILELNERVDHLQKAKSVTDETVESTREQDILNFTFRNEQNLPLLESYLENLEEAKICLRAMSEIKDMKIADLEEELGRLLKKIEVLEIEVQESDKTEEVINHRLEDRYNRRTEAVYQSQGGSRDTPAHPPINNFYYQEPPRFNVKELRTAQQIIHLDKTPLEESADTQINIQQPFTSNQMNSLEETINKNFAMFDSSIQRASELSQISESEFPNKTNPFKTEAQNIPISPSNAPSNVLQENRAYKKFLKQRKKKLADMDKNKSDFVQNNSILDTIVNYTSKGLVVSNDSRSFNNQILKKDSETDMVISFVGNDIHLEELEHPKLS